MQSDPFEYLQNAGDHFNTWVLIGGPILLFSLVGLLLIIFVKYRRSREQKELDSIYKDPNSNVAPSAKAESQDLPTHEDLERAPKIASLEVTAPTDISEIQSENRDSWMERLRGGLTRTRSALSDSISSLFAMGAKIDDETLERIHEILYRGDVGVKTSDRLVEGLRTRLGGQNVDWSIVKSHLGDIASEIFVEAERPLNQPKEGLFVILVVGVNGVGKTTTIGKLAARFTAEGKKVILCAADTYRAAAIEQLMVWGDRNGVPVIRQQQGADPAAVAFDGVQAAKARGADILIIDTAGRLHNKNDLMAELSKINKSIGKGFEGAPHETWLVVDATTGQNAVQQVKAFSEVTNVTGVVVTKLDGTAKGGVVVGIADQFKIPLRYIGVGEKASDLRVFKGADFTKGLLDI